MEQEDALVSLMVAKRKALNLPNQQEREEAFYADGGAGASKMLEQYLANQGKVNEAADVLNEAQLKQFTQFQKAQLDMQKLGIQMMKNMAKKKD